MLVEPTVTVFWPLLRSPKPPSCRHTESALSGRAGRSSTRRMTGKSPLSARRLVPGLALRRSKHAWRRACSKRINLLALKGDHVFFFGSWQVRQCLLVFGASVQLLCVFVRLWSSPGLVCQAIEDDQKIPLRFFLNGDAECQPQATELHLAMLFSSSGVGSRRRHSCYSQLDPSNVREGLRHGRLKLDLHA